MSIENPQHPQPGSKPTLLLVSPYDPNEVHMHAADDLLRPLVSGLAQRFSLHVAAPSTGTLELREGPYSFHPIPMSRGRPWSRFGLRPSAVRMTWPRSATREVARLVLEIRPTFVHFEYLQAAEAGLKLATPWTCTLHDINERVFSQRLAPKGLSWGYRLAEYWRIRWLERAVIRKARIAFAFSDRDAAHVITHGGHSEVLNPGIAISNAGSWSGLPDLPVLVFAGAMRRSANQATLRWIIQEVMPAVWEARPECILRIVGDGADESLRMPFEDDRIHLVGRVPSFTAEFARASVALAPSIVDAGILLKALKAMSVGAPVVLNLQSATAFDGLHTELKVADGGPRMAGLIVELLGDPQLAERVGQSGREIAKKHYSWEAYVGEMTKFITSSR